ncbi:MAG: phosphate ABC transporter permease PstA [Deltaproteobacteria bacterium]|nr:phosphate ABC transporter permease PstA [Deltaproteobacteria bacterium]
MVRRQGKFGEAIFYATCLFSVGLGLLMLGALLVDIFADGWHRLSLDFLTSYPSRRPQSAGLLVALVGSLYLMLLTAIISLPIGVGAAIYLEEYARNNAFTRLLEHNIANLAALPSIIYGLLGLQLFVRVFHLERSLLAGAFTMALLVLPIIIMSSREAIKRVPHSLREAAFALGATRWEVIRHQVLPVAFPGILTGCILAFSRAIGETAPLITIGAITYMAFLPDSLNSPFTVLPLQIFNWISRPQAGFHANAAAGIIVLLVLLLGMNAVAVFLRRKLERRYRF